MLQEGESIGQYRVLATLGAGGMATVYKAYHARLDRVVAIKVMHSAFSSDPAFHTRFEREAQIVARLDHPNIVPVYDYAEHDGQPYLVMKFIKGRTLKAIMKDRALSAREILDIMTPVAGALDYAHQRRVLHQDIKPSNIMPDDEGAPYLTDFGLARIAGADESTISQGMMLGTPQYMSPEQAAGNRELDARTDLYSLGVILYELIVGRAPYTSETPHAIVHAHIYRPLPLPSSINPDVPPQVEAVLFRALAKDPADRYERAPQMISALAEAFSDSGFGGSVPQSESFPSAFTVAKAPFEPASSATSLPPPLQTVPAMPQARPARRQWGAGRLLLLLFVILVVCGLPLFTVRRLRAPAAAEPTPAVVVFDVPELAADDAQATLTANPGDPVAYLALARALWAADDTAAAQRALEAGLAASDNKAAYLLSGGQAAEQDSELRAAVYLYLKALAEASSDPAVLPTVRAQAGEYLYDLALAPRALTALELEAIHAEAGGGADLMVQVTTARLLISQNRLRLAEPVIRRAVSQDNTLAEGHLVFGDLYAAQGDNLQARREWQLAWDSADAPEWVRRRADELLNSTLQETS